MPRRVLSRDLAQSQYSDPMSSKVADIERQAMSLPPQQREQLAVSVWASLEQAPAMDPKGMEIALQRDRELASGLRQPVDHDQFVSRTGGLEAD